LLLLYDAICENKGKKTVDVQFLVEDTGLGIPRKHQKTIFEPFRQKEGQNTRKYGGTGLGLSITKRLVEMMDGEISLDSRLGHGSVFKVYFKQVTISSSKEIVEQNEILDVSNVEFESAVIMLVEDNVSNQIVFSELLAMFKFDISIANNGQEGVDMIDKVNPDIVFMDLQMPVMNGFDAARIIRDKPGFRSIPIIAVSATLIKNYSPNEIKLFDDFLLKPVSQHNMIRVLGKHLPYKVLENKEEPGNDTQFDFDQLFLKDAYTKDQLKTLSVIFNHEFCNYLQQVSEFVEIDVIHEICDKIEVIGMEQNIPQFITISSDLKRAAQSFQVARIEYIVNKLIELQQAIV
ncbi:MAG: ATP-binding protein, partial [Bacteroidales bacterium]|nr:ATP-binding protein [Bacteroidales bacterium]